MIDPKLKALILAVVNSSANDDGVVIVDQSAFDGLVDYLRQDQYAQDGGSHCPVCGSQHISTERYTTGHGGSWEGCTCDTCKSTWRDWSILTGFSDLVSKYA